MYYKARGATCPKTDCYSKRKGVRKRQINTKRGRGRKRIDRQETLVNAVNPKKSQTGIVETGGKTKSEGKGTGRLPGQGGCRR